MSTEHAAILIKEWQSLHNSHEQYEHFALIIKLVTVIITVVLLVFTLQSTLILLILAVLWLLEGIWKTYQARTSDRIIILEQAILETRQDNNLSIELQTNTFQFYSQCIDNRAGSVSLVLEYLKNAIKPTVMYPYLPLMLITLIA